MNYTIIRGSEQDLDTAEKAFIADAPWGAAYTPTSYFQGVFIEGEGFLFRLTCLEQNPLVTMTGYSRGVSADSCLELFMNFAPHKTNTYINFEMNAAGAYLYGIGRDRFGREVLSCESMPTVKGEILEDRWCVTLFVPLAAIASVYGEVSFEKGTVMKGNAFKCGGKNAPETHYLSWSPMQRTERDFHRPDCFGTFQIL